MESLSVSLGRETIPVWRARGLEGAPTVMLVHGLGVTGWLNWFTVIETISAEFDVVTFDMRGHGSGRRTLRFSLEQCADDVAEVASALGIERFFVAGYSMGGPIAKTTWRRHRHRVLGLVLAATAGEFARRISPRRIRMALNVARSVVLLRPGWVKKRVLNWAIYRLGHIIPPARIEEEIAGHRFNNILQAAEALSVYSAFPWLDEIDVPVAVVVTADDDRIRPESQRLLASSIRGASVFETPGTHTACITDAETFGPAMLLALRDVWQRSESDAISA